ncbi:MAG: carboxypeptidase regulatory-like domain-containing protein [Acidobacteriota bacterium]|nr:carboxypeptidase regulatory-like domain-containing protein [Acidobacteriota bacterium]
MSRQARFICCCAFAALANAQEFRSTITGAIKDPQGAGIPGAVIAATQVETGAKFTTVSEPSGQYTIPFVPPGAYQLVVTSPGFKKYDRTGFQVTANERLPLDIVLELGQISETMVVSADASIVESSTASSGQVINSRQIENIPLNGRTPLTLAQLSFGVIPNSDPRFNRPFDNAGPSGFSIGGAPAQSNEILLDGAPDVTANDRVSYNPPVDTIQEVKVEIFQADAAYGHTGGGTVNQITKSGTNKLHGTAYEFNQTSAVESRNFFLSRSGQKLPVGRFNQYGTTVGGPVFLPKVFDGRNRLFFFLAYEGIKDSYPETITTTVPTAAERNGDFSQLLNAGSNYQIYNPYTGVAQDSRIARQPFAGNLIPANLINPIAKNYLQFYPLPNAPGNSDGARNYVANSVRSDVFDSEFGRLDYNISDRHKIFGTVHRNDRTENRGNLFFNIASGNFLTRANRGANIDDVYTFNPTTLLNTRISWNRFIESNAKPSSGYDFAKLGFPAALAAVSPQRVLPIVSFGGYQQLGDNGGNVTPFDIYQIFSSLNKIRGSHNLKFGVDLRLYRESNAGLGNSSGAYAFGTQWTRGPLDNSSSAPLGQDFAAFLLGLPASGSGGFDVNAARTNQAGYFALYAQDDYRVRSSLVLNFGIRYDKDLPTTERYNRTVNGFDASAVNPAAAAAQAAYAAHPIPERPAAQFQVPGGLLFAGSGRSDVYSTHSHYFSPRLGFAWTPGFGGGKTVLRGGYSVFVFPIITTGINQPGFSQTTEVVSTLDSYLTPNATLSNPFPFGIQRPTGSSQGLATFDGKPLTFYNPHPLNPYSQRWTFGVQRQLSGNLVIEAGYIGNHAVHLPVDRQLDFLPRQYLSNAPFRDQPVIDRNTANVTNPFSGLLPGTTLNGSTTSRGQLLLPYPEFTGIREQQVSEGSSYFHMAQVRLEKRFSQGLQLLANFSYSRLMEMRGRLNDSDINLEKRVSPDDRPLRFVISGNYELPFGKGKAFGANAGPLASRIVGGWVLSGVYTRQSGAPVAWGNVIYLGGPLHWNSHNVDHAFDTTRFVTASTQQLSNNIRTFPTLFNTLRQDGPNTMDAALLKNTQLTEALRLQFRVEFFNVFNHPEFNAPDLSATSSTFGQITGQANDIGRVGQFGLRLIW